MSEWMFYKDEKEEHRLGLGKYAGEMKYVSGNKVREDSDFTVGIAQYPFMAYCNEKCDNINLVEDGKGLFCNHCCHYHAIFNLKGIKRVYQALSNKGYDTPAPTCINPGKYRSDWTSDEECFDNPYPTDPKVIDVTPGPDFWQRLNERMAIYKRKVEVGE